MDKTKQAVDVFNKHANRYQEKFMDTSLYHATFDLFCSSIAKQNAEVLEAACGPGNITQYLLSRRPDLHILGTDLAPAMITLAKVNNPTATFQLMDARDIGATGKRYDALMCGFCLPYLSKTEALQFIRDAAAILQPDGVLYLSTMEDDYEKSGWQSSSSGDQVYMHYHEAGYLTDVLTESGFRIVDLQRIIYPENEGITTDLVIIAVKQAY